MRFIIINIIIGLSHNVCVTKCNFVYAKCVVYHWVWCCFDKYCIVCSSQSTRKLAYSGNLNAHAATQDNYNIHHVTCFVRNVVRGSHTQHTAYLHTINYVSVSSACNKITHTSTFPSQAKRRRLSALYVTHVVVFFPFHLTYRPFNSMYRV